jgi:hypothetical protein
MFDSVDWRNAEDIGRELKRDFVVAVQKLAGGRAIVQPRTWYDVMRKGLEGKKPQQFWRSASQSLQFDVPQMLTDELGQVQLKRALVDSIDRLVKSTKAVLEDNKDVWCHPNFYVERKAFMVTLFWYVEFVRLG